MILQGRATDADAVAQKMEREGSLGGKLDPGQSREATVTAALDKLRKPCRRIVISQGDEVKTGLRSLEGETTGRHRPVGGTAVQMQIDVSQKPAPQAPSIAPPHLR